jgi:hypothetical protein
MRKAGCNSGQIEIAKEAFASANQHKITGDIGLGAYYKELVKLKDKLEHTTPEDINEYIGASVYGSIEVNWQELAGNIKNVAGDDTDAVLPVMKAAFDHLTIKTEVNANVFIHYIQKFYT